MTTAHRICQTRVTVKGDPDSTDRVRKSTTKACGAVCLPGKSTCARHAAMNEQSATTGLVAQHNRVVSGGGNHAEYLDAGIVCPACQR